MDNVYKKCNAGEVKDVETIRRHAESFSRGDRDVTITKARGAELSTVNKKRDG